MLRCNCNRGGQPEGEMRVTDMAGESIYATVRLRLTASCINHQQRLLLQGCVNVHMALVMAGGR